MAELGLAITGVAISVPAFIDSILRLADSLLERAKLYWRIDEHRQLCDQIIGLNKSAERLAALLL